MKRPRTRRGSAVLLAVGLLTLLAIIGTTFIVVAFMDRRESHSMAALPPFNKAALVGLNLALDDRARDLHITTTAGRPYEGAATPANLIDYPSEDADPALSSFQPQFVGTTLVWPHLSNLGGFLAAEVTSVSNTSSRLVDTDGYSFGVFAGDAIPFDTGMRDSAGRRFYTAIRLIDASGLINVNAIHDQTGIAAVSTTAMNVTNIQPATGWALGALPWPIAVSGSIHLGRTNNVTLANTNLSAYWLNVGRRPMNPTLQGSTLSGQFYLPYDIGDMLSTCWGGAYPVTTGGRLRACCTNNNPANDPVFLAYRRYLTTLSSERIFVPQPKYVPPLEGDSRPQTVRADLNRSTLEELYNAYYNALPRDVVGYSDSVVVRRRTAAQLAVNTIDFSDTNSDVTVVKFINANGDIALAGTSEANDPANPFIYGIERQPYVTELFLKKYQPADTSNAVRQYSAIELFNPYRTALNLENYVVQVNGSNVYTFSNTAAVPALGRLVMVSSAAIIPVNAAASVEVNQLDLGKDVAIFRPRAAGALCDVTVATAHIAFADPAENTAAYETWQWDDGGDGRNGGNGPTPTRARARWSILKYTKFTEAEAAGFVHDYTNNGEGGSGTRTAATTNLGIANFDAILPSPDTGGAPCPVFVRNDIFINVGETNRVFYVGPTPTQSLSDRLTDFLSVNNGRLPMGLLPAQVPVGGNIPTLPLGLMVADYLMVDSPMRDTVDNDGDLTPDNAGEESTYGKLNIGTAPPEAMQCLPGIASLTNSGAVAYQLAAYRDKAQYWIMSPFGVPAVTDTTYTANFSNRATALSLANANLRLDWTGAANSAGPGFASVGEAALVLQAFARWSSGAPGGSRLPCMTYTSGNTHYNYALQGADTDDGLVKITGTVGGVADLTKYFVNHAWMSNQVTVRSDVYIAYIAVLASDGESAGTATALGGGNQLIDGNKTWSDNLWQGLTVVITGGAGAGQINRVLNNNGNTLTVESNWTTPPGAGSTYQVLSIVRRYVAIIDRGNCRLPGDRPRVLAFTELR